MKKIILFSLVLFSIILNKNNLYSENNIIYILAEYSSNNDLYKVLLILKNINNNYTIEKFKIDKVS